MSLGEVLRGPERDMQAAWDAAAETTIDEAWELAADGDRAVRLRLAQLLPAVARWDAPSPELVDLAIELSKDEDGDVRDWATATLGDDWRAVDSEDLRDALAARLDDPHDDARCEGLAGLAYRLDPRALPLVRDALSRPDGDVWRLELVAAGALGDPSLHELVLLHLDGWDDDDDAADLVRRLTDPAGPGADLLEGVEDYLRRRAYGRPVEDVLPWWEKWQGLLRIAPHREAELQALLPEDVRGLSR